LATSPRHHSRRRTDSDGVWRHIGDYHRVCSYDRAVAYPDGSEKNRSGSHYDIVAKDGVIGRTFGRILLAYRDIL